MAISLVKAGTVVGSGSPLFGQPTAAGHLLVATVANADTFTSTCSDPTWVEAVQVKAAANSKVAIFYKQNCSANEVAPTFTNALLAQLSEFTAGAGLVLVRDRVAGATDQPSGGNVAASLADSLGPGELVVTGLHWWGLSSTAATANTYNNGAAATNLSNNDPTTTLAHFRFAYGVTTGNATPDTATVTYTQSVTHSAYALASFVAVSATLSLAGAASGEAFGANDEIVRVQAASGVATGETFGTDSISRRLAPTGVASSQAFGPHNLLRLLATVGVASAQAFGLADALRLLAQTGIASSETVGAHALRRLLAATGISSRESFGTAKLARVVAATAIAPGGAGTPTAVRLIFASTIAPAETFGTPFLRTAFAPLDTNVLVSDHTLDIVTVGEALLMSVIVSDMLADAAAVSEG